MRILQTIVALVVFILPIAAFIQSSLKVNQRLVPVYAQTALESKTIRTINAPDFYWQYRLERLISKKGAEFAFDAKNYPDAVGYEALYNSYYLDLVVAGKSKGINWVKEKDITDSEWLAIYNNISKWSQETAKKNKPDINSLPKNDFDLLKQFYPQLDFRELETPFIPAEVGENFPYASLKELLSAATSGKLNVPGYAPTTVIEGTKAREALAALKEKSLAKIEVIYENAIEYATRPFLDEQSKIHYQNLRKTLGDFPQSDAEWAVAKANFEKELDEAARLAAKKDDHHHHEGEDHLSPAEEFQAKYGLNLDELQETFNRFKSNPDAFLESSIVQEFGKNGLDIWKKSQEFSAQLNTISAAEKAKIEAEFTNFLKSA